MENQETIVQNTFDIPESNMERLNSEVAKLNRRAAKIGVDPISVSIITTFMKPVQHMVRHWMTPEEIAELPTTKYFTISIVGKGPKIEGYKFVGTLDHKSIPGSVIVQSVPGETVPGEFFEASTVCDHCNKSRIRTETFVVEKDDGTFMQVGRSCLRDFFGHEPERIARFLSRVIVFVSNLDSDEWGMGGGRMVNYLNGLKVLENTIAMIRTYGWMARSAADYGDMPTADRVRALMLPSIHNEEDRRRYKDFAASIKHKDEDAMEAIKAVNWLEDQTGDSSYIHNLKTLAKDSDVPENMLGYWCSVVSSYQRAMDKLEQAKQENILKLNEYLGEIKQRLDFEITITGISYTPSDYGTVTIVRMRDTDGRTLVWFANTDVEMETGGKYKVKATIKKHEEYRDWKQTQVNRLKVLEEVATA